MPDTIKFDATTAKAFRAAYKQALANQEFKFTFQGKEVLTTYAKYLDAYLVMRGLLPAEIN